MTESIEFPHSLSNGLVLRAVETDTDADKVVAINTEIHGPDAGGIARHWLFQGHPSIMREDWLFIEDPETGQAVATLNLIPMTWRYGGGSLPVAELGFVATRPEYRRRGLQRILSNAFDRMARDRLYSLAAIEGIPGFYGQFGYAYALPLDGGFDLAFEQIPQPSAQSGYEMDAATPMDVPALKSLYDASLATLDIAAPRDAELWTHQVSVPPGVTFYGNTTMIKRGGRTVGYLRWNDDDWIDRLRILELAVEGGPSVRERILAALRFAGQRARAAEKQGIRLCLPTDHPAVAVARYLGAHDSGHYGWQIKVLDPVSFISDVKKALQLRLAESVLAGYTGSLVFDLYRSRLLLRFKKGRIEEINTLTGDLETDARMKLRQATQLWLGWRSRAALEAWHPDFWTRDNGDSRHLIDVLFPETQAYIYTPY